MVYFCDNSVNNFLGLKGEMMFKKITHWLFHNHALIFYGDVCINIFTDRWARMYVCKCGKVKLELKEK